MMRIDGGAPMAMVSLRISFDNFYCFGILAEVEIELEHSTINLLS